MTRIGCNWGWNPPSKSAARKLPRVILWREGTAHPKDIKGKYNLIGMLETWISSMQTCGFIINIYIYLYTVLTVLIMVNRTFKFGCQMVALQTCQFNMFICFLGFDWPPSSSFAEEHNCHPFFRQRKWLFFGVASWWKLTATYLPGACIKIIFDSGVDICLFRFLQYLPETP